jgi:hypothetical protein
MDGSAYKSSIEDLEKGCEQMFIILIVLGIAIGAGITWLVMYLF